MQILPWYYYPAETQSLTLEADYHHLEGCEKHDRTKWWLSPSGKQNAKGNITFSPHESVSSDAGSAPHVKSW